jgi:hypothetical protein
MCTGHKMTSALYLRSPEGTGKTIPCDFFRKCVLGEKICYTLSNPKILCGGFNAPLCGKFLVVCEELPSNSEAQW